MKQVLNFKFEKTFKELKFYGKLIKIPGNYHVKYAYIKTTKNDSKLTMTITIPSMGKGIHYTRYYSS